MGNGWLSIVVLFCICLLAACATDFYVGHVGPPPGSLFDDNQLNIQLTSVNQLYNYNKTCQLGVIFTNKSEIELKPKFKMLLFDLGGDTVGQEPLDFPVVIPGRNFNGVKDVLLIGCARIASIRLTRLQ